MFTLCLQTPFNDPINNRVHKAVLHKFPLCILHLRCHFLDDQQYEYHITINEIFRKPHSWDIPFKTEKLTDNLIFILYIDDLKPWL